MIHIGTALIGAWHWLMSRTLPQLYIRLTRVVSLHMGGGGGGSNKNVDVGAMEQDEEEDYNQFNSNLARRHNQMYLPNSCCLFGKGKTTNAQWETFLEDGKIGIRHRDEHPFILFESYKELSFLPV